MREVSTDIECFSLVDGPGTGSKYKRTSVEIAWESLGDPWDIHPVQ